MRRQDNRVLETYAGALLEAARRAGELDRVFAEAGALRGILDDHPVLLRLLERPAIEKEEKKALVRRVFAPQLLPLMLYLPLLLIDHHRGGLWNGVLAFFVDRVERERGILNARIATARPLSADERDLLKTRLERFTGKQLRIDYEEEPDLLGGVVFRCDDLLIDTSLRRGLSQLRRLLLGVRVAG